MLIIRNSNYNLRNKRNYDETIDISAKTSYDTYDIRRNDQ